MHIKKEEVQLQFFFFLMLPAILAAAYIFLWFELLVADAEFRTAITHQTT